MVGFSKGWGARKSQPIQSDLRSGGGPRLPIAHFKTQTALCTNPTLYVGPGKSVQNKLGHIAEWKSASVRFGPRTVDLHRVCIKRTYLCWSFPNTIVRDPTIIVMQGCHHNVIESLQKRYLKQTPEPILGKHWHPKDCEKCRSHRDEQMCGLDPTQSDTSRSTHEQHVERDSCRPSDWQKRLDGAHCKSNGCRKLDHGLINRIIKDLAAKIKNLIEPFDKDKFILNKKGPLRKRYVNAYNSIIKNGFDVNRDSDISAFVKNERYYEEGKSPRMIMGRNPKFNLYYAQIIEPIERAFFKLPQVANACDYAACGEKFSKLVGEWFIENDMSKYEASQRKLVLDMEYMVYSLVMPEHLEFLRELFAIKLHKNGKTNSGVKFTFEYCRGSGDMDTSLGNGILNYISTQYFLIKNFCPHCQFDNCKYVNCKTFSFVLKGDDSYMSVPRFCTFLNYYESFGFDAKLILRKSPHEVEFCSGHFIEISPGHYTYVQKLDKILKSLTTCINEDILRHGWTAHYYKSLGMMYKVLYKGIPYYEDIADFLLQTNINSGLNLNLVDSYNLTTAFESPHNTNINVNTDLAICSVALVNNKQIVELEHLKEFLRTHRLELPVGHTKICRTKNPKVSSQPPLDFELLNTKFNLLNACKPIREFWF